MNHAAAISFFPAPAHLFSQVFSPQHYDHGVDFGLTHKTESRKVTLRKRDVFIITRYFTF